MLKPIFKPYLKMVKPIIHFLDGDDDDFDLTGLPGGGEGKTEEELAAEKAAEEEGKTEEELAAEKAAEDEGKTEEELAAEKAAEDEGKTEEELAAEKAAADEGKTEEELAAEKAAADEGKTEEELAAEKAAEEKEEDFFEDINTEEDNGVVEDYKPLATDLGIELENPKSRTEFVEKVNGQIKDAQQKLDLTGFNETSQRLIKLANEGVDVAEFFNNPKITQYNGFLALTPEAKYIQVREGQLANKGLDAEAMETKITEEIDELSTRELKDLSDGYDSEIKEALNTEIVSVLGDKETQMAAAKSKVESEIETEKQNLIKYVDTQTEYMGIPLTEANKKGIVNAIKNGTFDLAVEQNPAASKFNAFMFTKFYSKFVQQSKKNADSASKDGYRKGLGKGKDTVYNKKPNDGGAKGAGGHKEKWADMKDIE